MCTTTAAASDFSSFSSAATRSWSLRIRPSILTRAIESDVANAPRPPGVATAPTAMIAAIAIKAATTRQNVSLRRILRRSTITSESSDIEILPEAVLEGSHGILCTTLLYRALNTSIASQYEENMALCRLRERRDDITTDIDRRRR